MAGKGGGRADRTTTAKSEATRARVLDAAARVLAREGYSGTRLTDVAREADIQAPAIYYYFASREELIEEVAATGASTLLAQVEAALEAVGDGGPLDRIDAVAEAHIRFTMTAPDFARAVLRNGEQFPVDMPLRHVAVMQRYQRLWSGLLREAQQQGLMDASVDLTIARHLAIGALNSAMDWWAPGRTSVTKVVAQTRFLLRHGLGGA